MSVVCNCHLGEREKLRRNSVWKSAGILDRLRRGKLCFLRCQTVDGNLIEDAMTAEVFKSSKIQVELFQELSLYHDSTKVIE